MIEINEGASLTDSTKDGSVKCDTKLKRIDFCGTRCYERGNGVYYPSVTSILGAAPVDPFFMNWVQEVGKNAELLRNQAAKEGTQVHEALEKLVAGKTVDWKDTYGNAKYSLKVWQMILRGAEFLNTYKPEILGTEMFLYSDYYHYAGTADLLCKMDGEVWLLDWKTSNQCGLTYYMQLAAYAKALEEIKGIHVDRAGILWLKALTRGPRKGNIQGENWQLLESKSIDKDFEAFLKIRDVFYLYNPEIKPLTKSYPTEIKLDY